MSYQGKIQMVDSFSTGARLLDDTASGATTIVLDDITEFLTGVDAVQIGNDVYVVAGVNEDASTITLGSGLVSARLQNEDVLVYPYTEEKKALVQVDDLDDTIWVTLPHSLYDQLDVGIRDGNSETVLIDEDRGGWVVQDIVALVPAVGVELAAAQAAADAAAAAASTAQSAADGAAAAASTAQTAANTAQATANNNALRGSDLVLNGNGILGTNTNFSSFDFHGEDAPLGTKGSFWVKTTGSQTAFADSMIPYTPGRSYVFRFLARQTVPGTGAANRMYGFIAYFDGAGNSIQPSHIYYIANTTTTLAADLKPGDTTVQLTDGSNWYGSASKPSPSSSQRGFIVWNYVDPFGKAWPVGSYSRNVYLSLYAEGSLVGNTITLSTPWPSSRGTIPAGTSLSNSTSGGIYPYMATVSNITVPESWTEYSETFNPTLLSSASQAVAGLAGMSWNFIPAATAQVRPGWLLNYSTGGGRHAVAGVSFSDVAAAAGAAAAAAGAAQAANNLAAGKNTTVFDVTDPVGAPARDNDTWYRMSDDKTRIVGIWQGVSGAWQAREISHEAVASIDAATITVGFMRAERLGSGEMAAELAIVGRLLAGMATGRRVEVSPDGVFHYDTDGSVRVAMPTDANSPVVIEGDIVGSSLTLQDKLALRGQNNEVSKGSKLVLAGSTSSPTSPPTLSITYEKYDGGLTAYLYNTRGFHHQTDSGSTRYLGGSFFGSSQVWSPTGYYVFPEVTDVNGSKRSNLDLWSSTVVAVGTSPRMIIAGCTYTNGSGPSVMRLYSYDVNSLSSGGTVAPTLKTSLAQGSPNANFSIIHRVGRCIASSGGEAAYKSQFVHAVYTTSVSPRTIVLNRYDTADSGITAATAQRSVNAPWGSSDEETLIGVAYGSSLRMGFPGANQDIWLIASNKKVYAYNNTASTRLPELDFNLNGSPGDWDIAGDVATNGYIGFRSAPAYQASEGQPRWVTKYSNNHWDSTATSSKWWVSPTWYDPDVSNGVHETGEGSPASINMVKRASLLITVPPFPPRPDPTTVDDVLAARVYLGRGASKPARAVMEYAGIATYPVRAVTVGDFTFPASNAVAPPPSSTNFPTVTPAALSSADGALVLRGDGTATIQGFDFSVAGYVAQKLLNLAAGYVSAVMSVTNLQASDTSATTRSSSTPVLLAARGGAGNFIAPPSGKVKIVVGGLVKGGGATGSGGEWASVGYQLRGPSTPGSIPTSTTGTIIQDFDRVLRGAQTYVNQSTDISSKPVTVTGLTPGESYWIGNMIAAQGTGSAQFNSGWVEVTPQP